MRAALHLLVVRHELAGFCFGEVRLGGRGTHTAATMPSLT
jgi:hypothetical protein